MSVTLDEYVKAIESVERWSVPTADVLRQLATEVVELRQKMNAPLMLVTPLPPATVEAMEKRLRETDARVTSISHTVSAGFKGAAERLTNLEEEAKRLHGRIDSQAAFGRDRFSDLQAQVTANDNQHSRLTKDVRRLEDFAGFGTVMGRTLPNPLPKWQACTVMRMANAVVVTEYSNGLGHPFTIREAYTFDDFEIAGRFVAAVLTQKLPVFDQAVGYAAEQKRQQETER